MLYENFDCLVDPLDSTGNTYKIRVLESPAGQAEGIAQLPFSSLELENLVLNVSFSRTKLRHLRSPKIREVQAFGERLYEAFFADELGKCLERSLDVIESKGTGLRLRLRLKDTPKLLELPWEYLYNPTRQSFFCLSDHTSLIRYLAIPQIITPLKVKLPLRALVMVAAPQDELLLDIEQEWENLNTAAQELKARGLFEIDRLEIATLNALSEKLREKDYHIFHFIGHGSFDQHTHTGNVVLEDKYQNGHSISGEDLANVLKNEKATLRLAILNACEGARTSCHDTFAGTAQKITQRGIPAVVAMQFAITDAAAITFTKEFYSRLAKGLSLDRTLAETRQALYGENHKLEWATPVLYMRTPDSKIFEIEELPPNKLIRPTEPNAMQDEYDRLYAQQTALSVLHHLNALPKEAKGLSARELVDTLGVGRRGILIKTLHEQAEAGVIEQVNIQKNTFWRISETGKKLVSRLQESLGTWVQSKRT